MRKACGLILGVSIAVLLMSAGDGGTASQAGMQKSPQITPTPVNSQNIRIDTAYGKMPLYFIPNQGQMDKQVAYYVQGKDKTIYFTPGGITFALTKPAQKEALPSRLAPDRSILDRREERSKAPEAGLKGADPEPGRGAEGGSERWVVKLEFVGADKSVKPIGEAETGAVVSYFKGKPKDWHAGLPTYSKIIYPDLWPGIDLVYYGTVNRLKYEFIVHPGADPSKVRLAYRGAESVSVDGEGRLKVMSPAGGFCDDVPVAYQEIGGKRQDIKLAYKMDGSSNRVNEVAIADQSALNDEVESKFTGAAEEGAMAGLTKLDGAGRGSEKRSCIYGFDVEDYDPSLPLVLDPAILVYCGYIGGSSGDLGYGIAVDSVGNAYITGTTSNNETTFPVTVGPDLTYNGQQDAFVAKVNSSGSSLAYCGYIGGATFDNGYGIAVDSAGNAYIAGNTSSTEVTFPVTVGPDLTYNGGQDAFVAKVNAAGTALVYCGYLGGSLSEKGYGIAVDSAGNAYIAGETSSTEATFPVTVGPGLSYRGLVDTFIAKINSSGTGLVYCGYIGGQSNDYCYGIAVDNAGNAFVTGSTGSTESTFPVTVGPDLTHNGNYDAFVAKVDSSGAALSYCGYIGGQDEDIGSGITVDNAGNAFITGWTYTYYSPPFPVTVGPDLTSNGLYDGFIAKINPSGTALDYCGYIGGGSSDYCCGIAVDKAGNAYVTGYTASTETTFPVTAGPDLTYNGGTFDAFVVEVNSSGTALTYCGYIGGSQNDYGFGLAVDSDGNAYIVGYTYSSEATFPVTVGPGLIYKDNFSADAFVAKVSYWDVWAAKHAVGDFDGDGAKEVAVDFGANGIYLYNNGSWTQISSLNPESLLAADVDGDNVDEIVADMGATGLWLWNSGVWNQLSGVNVESMAVGDVDADGADEIVGDFGTVGLWLYNGGSWTQLSGVNADYVTTANVDGTGGDEIIGDFGPIGLWVWNAGVWTQLSGVNADYVTSGKMTGGGRFLMGDFGPTGLWIWSVLGGWIELSGVNADYMIAANIDADPEDEIVGDFGATGLWLYNSGAWTILSGVNAEFMIRADVDGNGTDEIVADFGTLGLWMWNTGAWTQLSGVNPEYMLAADVDGDNKDEIMADFGTLGLWLWNEGSWSQISANNPD